VHLVGFIVRIYHDAPSPERLITKTLIITTYSVSRKSFSKSTVFFIKKVPVVRITCKFCNRWTLVSWIKIDQLDVTFFIISLFNAQRVSSVSTSILRSLRLICWVISCAVLLWFDVCWRYGVVRLGWCDILMQAEALVPQPHRKNNTHRTRAIQPMK